MCPRHQLSFIDLASEVIMVFIMVFPCTPSKPESAPAILEVIFRNVEMYAVLIGRIAKTDVGFRNNFLVQKLALLSFLYKIRTSYEKLRWTRIVCSGSSTLPTPTLTRAAIV
jgi:hypothetical protein